MISIYFTARLTTLHRGAPADLVCSSFVLVYTVATCFPRSVPVEWHGVMLWACVPTWLSICISIYHSCTPRRSGPVKWDGVLPWACVPTCMAHVHVVISMCPHITAVLRWALCTHSLVKLYYGAFPCTPRRSMPVECTGVLACLSNVVASDPHIYVAFPIAVNTWCQPLAWMFTSTLTSQCISMWHLRNCCSEPALV
jgi:hypothetical protein